MSDLIFDALPFGALCYGEPNAVSNAIGYAKFYSRSHDAMHRVYDEAGNMLETHEQAAEGEDRFGEWNLLLNLQRLSGKETWKQSKPQGINAIEARDRT